MLNSIALFVTRWLVNSSDPRDPARRGGERAPDEDDLADGTAPRARRQRPQPAHRPVLARCAVLSWCAFVLRRTTFGFETITVGTQPARRALRRHQRQPDHHPGDGAVGRLRRPRRRVGGRRHELLLPARARSPASASTASPSPCWPGPTRSPSSPAAFLWGSLLAGAPLMQQEADVSIDVVRIIQSMVLLFVAADAIVRYVFRLQGAAGPAHSTPRRPAGARHDRRRRTACPTTPRPGPHRDELGEGTARRRLGAPADRRRHLRRPRVCCSLVVVAPNLSGERRYVRVRAAARPARRSSFNPVTLVARHRRRCRSSPAVARLPARTRFDRIALIGPDRRRAPGHPA